MMPQNDFMFKKIFGQEGSEEITKDFISKIIGQKIRKIEFKDKEKNMKICQKR